MLTEINNAKSDLQALYAENKTLRQMTNVPDNFGIKVDQIKLHDKEKIEDYKKLIKILQDDNLKLEKERANLKHALKMQSVMIKNENPGDRYKNLSSDQLL